MKVDVFLNILQKYSDIISKFIVHVSVTPLNSPNTYTFFLYFSLLYKFTENGPYTLLIILGYGL